MEPTIAPSVAPEASATEGVSESTPSTESATESKLAPENDPNESYSDWLDRINGKSKKTEEKAEPKKDSVLDKFKADLEKDKNVKDQPKEDLPTKEPKVEAPAPIQDIKVGDKSYTAKDIETLTKDHTEVKTAHETLQKQATEFINTLKTNPGQVLDMLLKSPETESAFMDYLNKRYVEPLKFQALPAEDKLKHYEQKEQERIASEQAARAEQERAAKEQADQQAAENNRRFWTNKFSESLGKAGLPDNAWTQARMAGYIQRAFAQKIQVTPDDVIQYVREDLVNSQKHALENASPEEISKLLGEEKLAALRAQDVAKFKQDKFENKNPSKGKIERTTKEKKRYSSPYDMMDDL